jgi:hypothetical protein
MFRAYAPIVRSNKFRQAAYGILSCLQLRRGASSCCAKRVYTEGGTARLLYFQQKFLFPVLLKASKSEVYVMPHIEP